MQNVVNCDAICLFPSCPVISKRVGRGLSLPDVARRLGEESPDTTGQRAACKGGGWKRKQPVTESVTENIPPFSPELVEGSKGKGEMAR